jgi:hypothetical protein
MATTLPYLATPGNISKALERIKTAPTPARVTQDFVKTKLQIRGGPGDVMTAFLRKIGLVEQDGSPSDLYLRVRNPATAGAAIAAAFRQAYAPLYEHHEYVHDLTEDELKGLIIQVTGCGADARMLQLTLKSIELLKEHADFEGNLKHVGELDAPNPVQLPAPANTQPPLEERTLRPRRLGMNLSYTINLNLPPSTDIAVFNAIFKSLKDNLLREIDEHAG